jgi:DNA-3-methyladenine glycosylase II
MTFFIRTEADLDSGISQLVAADPRLARVLAVTGRPPLRRREGSFAGLASIVVSQQLSTASASAIWSRLAAAYDPLDPAAIRRARPQRLKRIGLSSAKIRTLKAIATAITNDELDLTGLGAHDADDAHRILTSVHGIGPWTADIYLLVCLGHSDAWPAGDLALQEAARMAFALEQRPTTRQMGPLADPWRPWRAVAARLLWSYYRAVKGREGAPLKPTSKGEPDGRTA